MENATVPNSKTELQNMVKNQTAQLFHQKICRICHQIPKHKEWMEANESSSLNIFTVAKRTNYHRLWEAFYVGTHSEPIFDERLTWEGQSNKMAQVSLFTLIYY